MIKNIIFDIGNVLVTFDPLAYFHSYFDDETNHFLCEEVFASEQWLQVDQGLLSEMQARTYFLKKWPAYQKEIHILFDHWKGLMMEKEDTRELLKEVKQQGYHIYILSNIGKESYAYCIQQFSFFSLIDGGIYSYQEKLVKPDEKIFACLMERYQLLPGECVFIDDAQKNITTAMQVGMHGICFHTFEQVKKELDVILQEEPYVKN